VAALCLARTTTSVGAAAPGRRESGATPSQGPAPSAGAEAGGLAPRAGAPGRRDALLTQLSRRAPAWRALFLSALFAAVGAWALLAAAAWAPAGTGLAGVPLAWGSWAPPQSVGMAAPAWLTQLRAALLRASL